MQSLICSLSRIVGDAFSAEGLSSEFGLVRVSDRPDLAQFQCNGAMSAAKAAKKNPRAVAEAIVARLKAQMIFSRVEIAGPGFINIDVTDEYLSGVLAQIEGDPRAGVPPLVEGETMILDYGGPNIAKAMHVGHLRASIIGDSLRRLALFCGYKAIGDVHMGDWGTPMGMIISELEIRHPEWIYFNTSFKGPYPEESPVTMADLEEIYPVAAANCKNDASRMEIARKTTADLQEGRSGYYALWQHFQEVSIRGMKENFDALGVHFDLWNGESTVHGLIAPMVEELMAKGHAILDDGAVVVPVRKGDDDKEIPPLILYKRDGAVMYGTTDLATLVDRMMMRPGKIVYVVDQRQSLHFEQVFRTARLSKIVTDDVELTHAGFGTMNGTDGKPFKTRAGGVLKLEDLISAAINKALDRMKEANLAQDVSPDELGDIAHKVGVSAIKFADLQNQRTSDYIFDLDRMTAFEGKTGPYLLYQAVRIKSLLRKADDAMIGLNNDPLILQDEDRKLALILTELPEVIDGAMRNYMPHILCDYAYRLANAFSSFYGNCHILSEADPALKYSRLRLCCMVLAQMDLVLGILGLEIPDRM